MYITGTPQARAFCKSGYQIRLAAEGTGREEYRA